MTADEICNVCSYVRQPYEHPDTVQTCNECRNTSCCETCKDEQKIAIPPCCEGCPECTTTIECGNCSAPYCIYQCCGYGDDSTKMKDCKGCNKCDEVKLERETQTPHIIHCTECGENTCQECNFDGCHNGCDDGENIQIAQEIKVK